MACTLLLCLASASLATLADDRPFVPTDAYVAREVEGWTVRVNRRLLDEEADLGRRALNLLAVRLREVENAVPGTACRRLREVPIWVGVDDGHAPCAEYHPSRAWLVANGYNPDKARAVEIGNAARFLEWSPTQPSMILHELAHAYHDRVLGFDQPEIRAAFDRVRAAGLYDTVRHADGREQRHYALTDAQEFFAEQSEALFGRNDFFPFDRAELERHDPETARLLARLWGEGPQ